MDKGRDIIQGGAVINSSAATIIGLADVADSLSAIEKVVFEEKSCSFDKLIDAVNKNFEGSEALQKRLMNPDKTPKYGNDNKLADANVKWIVEMLDRAFGEKESYRGGKYRVGYWTMTNHAGLKADEGIAERTQGPREFYKRHNTCISRYACADKIPEFCCKAAS